MNIATGYISIEPVVVGEHTYIGNFTHLSQYTTIGRYCSIANLCTIGAQPHTLNDLTTYPAAYIHGEQALNLNKSTLIGNDVWIGANSVVLAGVKIGDGAVVGAGAVVTKDMEPYAIVVGNPARFLRYRFSATRIAELLASRWWELPIEAVRALPLKDVTRCLEILRAAEKVAA